ncbi:hypothetical protein T484DRAFT_1757888 [Baffinella frigidus]|jgi:hypothetical protein|nr:hypothetical protein T484DRAFT_1757888 [Cryptophyta sp. CCMP2293]
MASPAKFGAATGLLLLVCFPTSDGFRGGRAFHAPATPATSNAQSRPVRSLSFSSLDPAPVIRDHAQARPWADVVLDQMTQIQQQQMLLDQKKTRLMNTVHEGVPQENDSQELRKDIATYLGIALTPSALVILRVLSVVVCGGYRVYGRGGTTGTDRPVAPP